MQEWLFWKKISHTYHLDWIVDSNYLLYFSHFLKKFWPNPNRKVQTRFLKFRTKFPTK